jgi:hypothetical protein
MSVSLPDIAAPDAEAWAWANLRDIRGLTSFAYTATQLDPAGWLTSTFLQVDARSARRAPARDAAEQARRRLLGLPSAPWPDGVVCLVAVVEAPFWLPDDDGQPRYVARYEVRVHPRRPSPPEPRLGIPRGALNMPPAPPAEKIDPAEVQVGAPNGPGIYVAPPGTEPPDTTEDEWETPWRILGYLSEDGPTVGQSTDSTDITPWQSVSPIRSVITSRGVTLQFVMWQLNALTIAMYFDADEATPGTDGSIDMAIRTDTPQHLYAIGIDSADAERVLRLAFTRASLSSAGDMQLTRGAAVPLDVTLSALDDAGQLARVQLGPRAAATAPPLAGRRGKAGADAEAAA